MEPTVFTPADARVMITSFPVWLEPANHLAILVPVEEALDAGLKMAFRDGDTEVRIRFSPKNAETEAFVASYRALST
jgi:hypothetical protein